jgi:hypothetical protein
MKMWVEERVHEQIRNSRRDSHRRQQNKHHYFERESTFPRTFSHSLSILGPALAYGMPDSRSEVLDEADHDVFCCASMQTGPSIYSIKKPSRTKLFTLCLRVCVFDFSGNFNGEVSRVWDPT